MFDDIIEKSNYTILYAEDEPEVRSVYKQFFESYFTNVLVAENGDEAWEKYAQYKPAIIVLDILMPGMNGVEVAEKIREHDKDAIIMIMTANDTLEWYKKSVELNLRKFIKKGSMKFVEFENIIYQIIEELNEKYKESITPEYWYITPKDSNPELIWNTINQKIYKNGEEIDLSKKLSQIINYFYHNQGRIIPHDEIAKELWGEDKEEVKKTPNEQKIRAFLYTLKKEIGIEIFKSHYKQGYTLEVNAD